MGRLFFKSIIVILLLFSLLVPFVSGARVYGTIYDNELDTVSSVVVEVNSTPIQRHISRYGGYSFELHPGNYEITATYTLNGTSKLIAQELVTVVSQEGEYIVDLFVFPDINLDKGFTTETRPFLDWQMYGLFISAFIASLALVLLAVLYFKNKSGGQIISRQTSQVESPDVEYSLQYDTIEPSTTVVSAPKESASSEATLDIDEFPEDSKLKRRILQLIVDNDGEMTQKEIRKKIDLSEAKISQVLSELTSKNKIKKVKKGRSNVIVLS